MSTKKDVNEINHIGYKIERIYLKWAKKFNINYNTLLMLCYIDESSCCSQKDLCDNLVLPKTTVNSIIKTLKKGGIIDFKVSDEDKRQKIIYITDKGNYLYRDMLDDLYSAENISLDILSPDELDNLKIMLKKIVNEFEKLIDQKSERINKNE